VASSPELRKKAQDERDSLKRVQAAADASGVGVAVLGALIAPPAMLLALVPAAIRWRTSKELIVQERLIEDPPRLDFERATRPGFETLIPPRDLEDGALRMIVDYARASINASGYERAMIRAYERQLGARARGTRDLEDERAAEVERYAIQAAISWQATAKSLRRLADLVIGGPDFIEAEQRLAEIGRSEWSGRVLDAIPDGAAAWLFRVGVSADVFTDTINTSFNFQKGVFSELSTAITDNAETKRSLAVALQEPSDAPLAGTS
jgi:hypothetical protein